MIQFVHNLSFSDQVKCRKVGAMELMVLLRAMSKEMDDGLQAREKKMWNQEINNRPKEQGKVKGMKIY